MPGGGPFRHVPSYFADLCEIHAEQLVGLGPHVEIRASALLFALSLLWLAILRHGLFVGIHSGLEGRDQLLDFLVAFVDQVPMASIQRQPYA